MEWQSLATLVGMVAAIVGGVWAIENRFERKVTELKKEITENRNLIINYIARK